VSGAAGPLIVTSLDDVRGCLPLPRAMDLVEDALRDRRSARIVPVTLALDDGAGFRVVAGATGGAAVVRFGAAGRFWATGATRPNTWAAVFDPGTGELLALLRFPFADLRVAATLGAAARTLTAGPVPVTMIGAGNYAFTVLETLHAGTGIASLTVVSRTRANAEALAARVSDALGVPAVTAPTVPDAVAAAAVIVVGTNSPEPVLQARWLRGDELVLSYGLPSELDRSVYLAADRFAANDVDLEPASGVGRPHPLAGPDGRLERRPEALGDLLTNGATGLVVVRDGGGGVGDAALAAGLLAEIEQRAAATTPR
jgi:ornithine cyclodeaminase/alanine dehydrogenase-like protein (mu-crystallin family)